MTTLPRSRVVALLIAVIRQAQRDAEARWSVEAAAWLAEAQRVAKR